MKPLMTASGLVAVLLLAAPAWASGDAETGPSMDEVLAQTDAESAAAADAGVQAELTDGRQATSVQALQIDGDTPITSGTAFNPAISIILDTVYSQNFGGEAGDPPGFGGGHSHGHGHGGHGHGIEDGFQIREVEAVFSGSVDPYFDLMVQLAFFEDGVELEEGYFTTTSLPGGLQVKGGKFLSDVGYINRQHTHDWDFTDRPLVNEVMFGDEGLSEIGAQLSWTPATRSYSRFGVEILEGENPGVAQYVGEGRSEIVTFDDDANRQRGRVDYGLEDTSSPRLVTAFAKFGPDLGYDHALLWGISGGYADVWQQVETHSSGRTEVWDGDAWFAGLDFTYKYHAGRSLGHGNWTVQGEYFYREIDVDYENRDMDGFTGEDTFDLRGSSSGKFKQDGLYLQTVYGFRPRWNAGLRFDAVGLTNEAFDDDTDDGGFADFGTTYRYSAQVSYLPTEFSRLRFQLSQTDFSDGVHGHDDHDDAWRADLQFTYALGVHGAHDF